MEHSKQLLDELYANLTIVDEEKIGVFVGSEAIEHNKGTFVLVGRYLTEKHINFNALQNMLASIWRPNEGLEIHEIGGMRYSFIFYHSLDVQKVLGGGLWSFEQGMRYVNK